MPKPKSGNAAPPIPNAPFLHTGTRGDMVLHLQVISNGSKTQADGLYGELDQAALKVRLTAPAVDGKANTG